jgi:hypothetical protein
MQEVTRLRMLHSEELHNLHCSPNIVWINQEERGVQDM